MFPDASRIIPKRALIEAVRKADILFCLLHDTIDRAVIAANPKLRLIAAQSITPSNIDVAAATARRIPVTVVPPVTTEATADLTFGLMLAVARRMIEGDRMVRAGKFPGGQSRHLLGSFVWGKTIGLIGGGGLIGKAVARRAHGFSACACSIGRRAASRSTRSARPGSTYVPLDAVAARSPISSRCIRRSTRRPGIRSARANLRLMKKTAYIINTARGPIIDEAALVRALTQKADRRRRPRRVRARAEGRQGAAQNAQRRADAASRQRHAEVREAMANIVVDNILALLGGQRAAELRQSAGVCVVTFTSPRARGEVERSEGEGASPRF